MPNSGCRAQWSSCFVSSGAEDDSGCAVTPSNLCASSTKYSWLRWRASVRRVYTDVRGSVCLWSEGGQVRHVLDVPDLV